MMHRKLTDGSPILFSCANEDKKLFTSLANVSIVLRAFEAQKCCTISIRMTNCICRSIERLFLLWNAWFVIFLMN